MGSAAWSNVNSQNAPCLLLARKLAIALDLPDTSNDVSIMHVESGVMLISQPLAQRSVNNNKFKSAQRRRFDPSLSWGPNTRGAAARSGASESGLGAAVSGLRFLQVADCRFQAPGVTVVDTAHPARNCYMRQMYQD
eukprot:1837977-Rhodomonas_salina.1